MDYPRALSQIAEIHEHIAKGEIYRGYRSVPVAASGLVGLVAAAVEPRIEGAHPVDFVIYWATVAAIAGVIGLSTIAYNYVVHEGPSGRRRTRRVVGQFLPAIAAAGVLTASFIHVDVRLVALLPGIWAICFGVGTFASRPYLPPASAMVGLFYLAAGSAFVWGANLEGPASGWAVGGTFAVGQLIAATVLYWELERPDPWQT